jgi:hypothetical protein
MQMRRPVLAALALVVATALVGCGGGGAAGAGPSTSGAPSAPAATAPAGFELDSGNSAELTVKSTGSGAAVPTGEATAAVYVPAGAAADGAVWTITPLVKAPSGVKKPLTPGVYVDTSKARPSKPCLIGFMLPGKAPKNATIVKISEDGASTQIIPTARLTRDGHTLLTAAVDGFSSYTTSEEEKAAVDKAFVERAKARGKEVDFTIKVSGSETQKVEGWTFDYDFDMFASGGGVDVGGPYKGYATLAIKGNYKGPASIVKSYGKISGVGRDSSLQFNIIDVALTDLLTGASVEAPVGGQGKMNMKGMASLNMAASGPTASAKYSKHNIEGSDPVPFDIRIKGDDVQVEIPNVGIFPGKILRTTK